MSNRYLILAIIAFISTAICCSDNPTESTESLKGYIDGISVFPLPSSEFDRSLGVLGDTTDESSAGVMICSVEEFEMGRNMHEIVAFDPNAGSLWPGCIVQGQYVADGILNPVSVARTPITVGIPGLPELPVGELSRVISSPNQFNVAGALNEIVDTFIASGTTLPADFSFDFKETYEFEQGMLDLGISANWAGGNLRSRFQYEWESSKNTLLLKFTQKYYTVTVNPPSSSDSYFDPSVTIADLANYTSDGNPLCYVKSVTYGRMGILSITSSSSMSDMKASVDAAFDALVTSGSIDASAAYAQILQESEMKLLILGGTGTDDVISLTNPISGLMSWINSGLELNEDTRGVPISYSVAYLKDNTSARFQYTTSFKQRLCAYADQPRYVSVYRLACITNENGVWPALEGWCYVTLITMIPGLPADTATATLSFSGLDEGQSKYFTSAAWNRPIPRQAGTSFYLRIKIVENDDAYDDPMGDYLWEFTYPEFNPGTGNCSPDPLRCEYDQLYQYDEQSIRAYFRVNMDGNP